MSKKGFTLVEVLVVMGVIATASTAFVPSYIKSLDEKKSQQSVDAVRDAITTARNRALAEVGSPGAVDAQKYKYSGVKFVRGSGTYYQFRSNSATKTVCANVPAGTNVVLDSTKTLPNNTVARIAADETPTCVFFAFKTAEAVTTKGSGSSDAVSCSN